MTNPSEILTDVLLLLKLLLFNFYCYLEVIYKNLIPTFKNVDNEIVLITGAAGGIGRNLVKKFLELGSIVVCIDNNQKELNKLRDDMSKVANGGKKVHYYLLDLTSSEDIKTVCERIRNEIGHVNILINNAGIVNHGKLFLDLSQQEVTRLFQVNVLAHFWLCQEFVPNMLEKNHGHIVNVASVCGLQGAYKLTDYCSSKFAAVGFTESLRLELANINPNNNIVVSLVCPFHVQTKLFDGVEFSHLKWLGLSMSPEEVASCIVNGVLANKECIYIPRIPTTVIMAIKNLVTFKFSDYTQRSLDVNGSMDKFKGNKSH